jgi:NAD(P) transhydrogenase
MSEYDLVVIGSGPAGEKGAAQAAFFGKKVAVVERAALGGTVANTGTLPSKTLRETALFLSGFRKRELYGVDAGLKGNLTVKDLLFRERVVRDSERHRVAQNLDRHRVTLIDGEARFLDANTVVVRKADGSEEKLVGKVFLIATGSSPYRPPPYRFEEERIYDSDELLEMHALPKSLAVIGAGVIGCEYACMFAALGIEVHLVERRAELLAFLDAELQQALTREIRQLGVTIHFSENVKSADVHEQGVRLALDSGGTLEVDAVLVAAGRTGNTATLNLEAAGVTVDKRGRVLVNDHFQTQAPHIYAAGDVIGAPALASTSMEQSRIAMCHAFDRRFKERLAPILPYGIYTIPEVSMAGETEASLKEKNIPYVAGRASFAQNARGEIMGDHTGLLKLLFRVPDMKLLGVHVIGEQASELVHVGLTAMLLNATADLFVETCFNFPTLHEAYKYATYDAVRQRAENALGAAVATQTVASS